MKRRWLSPILLSMGTLMSLAVILSLPEEARTNVLVIFIVGLLIGLSTGELPGETGISRIINSLVYWIIPFGYLLAILILFTHIDGLFFMLGVLASKVTYPIIMKNIL